MDLIIQLVPINSAAMLKVSPPSLKNMQAFTPQCTSKNEMRNNPVKPISHLRPIVDVNRKENNFMLV
jgi:hypothetical protein